MDVRNDCNGINDLLKLCILSDLYLTSDISVYGKKQSGHKIKKSGLPIAVFRDYLPNLLTFEECN